MTMPDKLPDRVKIDGYKDAVRCLELVEVYIERSSHPAKFDRDLEALKKHFKKLLKNTKGKNVYVPMSKEDIKNIKTVHEVMNPGPEDKEIMEKIKKVAVSQ